MRRMSEVGSQSISRRTSKKQKYIGKSEKQVLYGRPGSFEKKRSRHRWLPHTASGGAGAARGCRHRILSPLVGDSLVPVPVCATVQLLFKIPLLLGGRCRCRCPGSDAADDVILLVGVSWQLLCLFYLNGGAVVWWSWSGEVEEKKMSDNNWWKVTSKEKRISRHGVTKCEENEDERRFVGICSTSTSRWTCWSNPGSTANKWTRWGNYISNIFIKNSLSKDYHLDFFQLNIQKHIRFS